MKNGKRVNDCVPKNEEVEQVDEISQDLKNRYARQSQSSHQHQSNVAKNARSTGDKGAEKKAQHKMKMRNRGMTRVYGEEVEQVDEANAPSTVKYKGKKYYSTGKKGKDAKTGAPSFEYSSDMDGSDERVWYNTKTKSVQAEGFMAKNTPDRDRLAGKLLKHKKKLQPAAYKKHRDNMTSNDPKRIADSLKRLQAMESVQVDEEMSAVERRKHLNLKKRAKQGNSQAKIRLKKFEDKFKDDLEADKRSAKQSTKAIKGKGAADPHSGQAFTGKGSGAGDDDNLVSQLRKAQDVDGKMDIRLPAGNKTARLPKALIDKLLAGYDRLQKPEDKKKFKMLLTKELRKKAK